MTRAKSTVEPFVTIDDVNIEDFLPRAPEQEPQTANSSSERRTEGEGPTSSFNLRERPPSRGPGSLRGDGSGDTRHSGPDLGLIRAFQLA